MVFLAAHKTRRTQPQSPLDADHIHWWDCFGSKSLTSISDTGSSASPAPLLAISPRARFGTVGEMYPWGPQFGNGYPQTNRGMRATCSDLSDSPITMEAIVRVNSLVAAGMFGAFINIVNTTSNYRFGVFQAGSGQYALLDSLNSGGDTPGYGSVFGPVDGKIHSIGWTFDRALMTGKAYWDGVPIFSSATYNPTAITGLTAVDIGHALGTHFLDILVVSAGVSNITRPQSYFQNVTAQIAASTVQ